MVAFDVEALGDAEVVYVREEIDFVSAPELQHVVELLANHHPLRRIVISLEDCSYCDSSCISVVLKAAHTLGPRFAVVLPPESAVRRIFEIVGLTARPYVFESLSDALESMPSDRRHAAERAAEAARQKHHEYDEEHAEREERLGERHA